MHLRVPYQKPESVSMAEFFTNPVVVLNLNMEERIGSCIAFERGILTVDIPEEFKNVEGNWSSCVKDGKLVAISFNPLPASGLKFDLDESKAPPKQEMKVPVGESGYPLIGTLLSKKEGDVLMSFNPLKHGWSVAVEKKFIFVAMAFPSGQIRPDFPSMWWER